MSEFEQIKKWLCDTRDEPLEDMDGFFAKRVNGYDEHMSYWKYYYKWFGQLVPKSAKTLLDVGCGTGLELESIFAKNPRLAVTGVDLSQTMLDKLKEKYADKKLNLVCGDYFVADLGKNYDVAIAFETLHHYKPEKKLMLFKRIRESLADGGFFIEGDYTAESDEMEKYLFDELSARRTKQNVAEDKFVHFDTPLTEAHEIELLLKAGFSKVTVLGRRGMSNTPMIKAEK